MSVDLALPILYFEPVAEVGGAERVLLSLLTHLDRKRFRPIVATLGRGPLLDELRGLDIPFRAFPRHRLSHLPATCGAIAWLAAVALGVRAAWIHAQGTKAQIYAGAASRLAGARSLWHIHDPPPPGPGWIDRLALAAPRDAIVANVPATLAGFERWIDRGTATIIPPGVDIPAPISPEEVVTTRERWKIGEGEFVIVNVGRLQEFKGHRHVLAATRILANQGLPIRVFIVGDALFGIEKEYPARIDRWIREFGIEDRVTRTGYLPDEDVRRLVGSADALVHAALAEPFGLAIAEAMALGVPPVAFDASGPALLIEGETSGLLVRAGDEDGLARALSRLARDPELARRLGKNARERVASRFSNAAMTRAFEEVYDSPSRFAGPAATRS